MIYIYFYKDTNDSSNSFYIFFLFLVIIEKKLVKIILILDCRIDEIL